MSATLSTDWNFDPKVWQDHIDGFFRRKLVYGAFAASDNTLESAPGLTINFPYFKTIGDVEEPGEDESLTVDNLTDDSFNATVKEVGKAVGIKKKAFKKSAASADRLMSQAQSQIGRRMAEKLDKDLLTEFSTPGNFVNGYTATVAGDTMTAKKLVTAKMMALGDRSDELKVAFLHSRQVLDLMNDSSAGFMKADAQDPNMLVRGFQGYMCGMAIVTVDSVPASSAVGGAATYRAFLHTEAAYAYLQKQDMEIESDYDLLAREWVVAADKWYAVKSYHGKKDSEDLRTVEMITTVSA